MRRERVWPENEATWMSVGRERVWWPMGDIQIRTRRFFSLSYIPLSSVGGEGSVDLGGWRGTDLAEGGEGRGVALLFSCSFFIFEPL